MYIKELEIQGFKSYKDQVGVDEFSRGHNTIVGRNGSGKSNFFRAIQFVLGEKSFSNLSHKERAELLHEGAGTVMTAHVQIVFDNSERRFPLDSDEVVLRRTIGLKKDEYFLNNKHVTKSDVINLLETAGFSRSNPYYIVQQGKVNALCLMKDEQRLDLLKEVAGTTVYEERRRISENILAETKKKREKIQDVVRYIEARLDELKDEKEELEAFRSLDRRKRALQYTLYELEMQNATTALESIDSVRETEASNAEKLGDDLAKVSEDLERYRFDLSRHEQLVKRCQQEAELVEAECANLLQNKTAVELSLKDIMDKEAYLKEQERIYEAEMQSLDAAIAENRSSLETTARPRLVAAREQVSKLRDEVQGLEWRKHELEAKQGRKSRFANQAERDAWLRGEIASVESAIADRGASRAHYEATLAEHTSRRSAVQEEVAMLETETNELVEVVKDTEKALQELKASRDAANEKRRDAWRASQAISREIQDSEDDLRRADSALKRSIPSAVASGLNALDSIARDLGLVHGKHIFGPLYELIETRDVFETAVEVAAGPSLTHVVVDTDETAARLMTELQKRRAGRLTFKPINQISNLRAAQRGKHLNPDSVPHDIVGFDESGDSEAAFPIITKVDCPEPVRPAVRAVLGKVLLCKDSATASTKRRELNVNCVTLEGEEVNRRGALTGGFYDRRSSKLGAAAVIRRTKAKLAELNSKQNEASQVVTNADQSVTLAISNISKREFTLENQRSTVARARQEIAQKRVQVQEVEKLIAQTQDSLEQTLSGLKRSEQQRNDYAAELATPMEERLSAAEQAELQTLRSRVVELKRQQTARATELAEAETQVHRLEMEINTNLQRRKDELLRSMGHLSGPGAGAAAGGARVVLDDDDDDDDDVDQNSRLGAMGGAGDEAAEGSVVWLAAKHRELELELQQAEARLADARSQLEEMDKETASARAAHQQTEQRLAEAVMRERELTESLRQVEDSLDKLITKRNVHQQTHEVSAQKIRELGALPAEELENLDTQRSTKALVREIKDVNKRLERFSHVNKKALDQFMNFSDRREVLLKRQGELDKGDKSIEDLIRHLDQQKDDDIQRTFRQVSRAFREIFHELSGGTGELVMITGQRKAPAGDGAAAGSSSTGDSGAVEEYIGVSPRVSFGSGDTFRMRQLSGGQRALVALTLIFAIQRCDPAPFYLFDEIDQALDQDHRAAVAAMIKRQSKTAQFITTTFRSELVTVSDATWGIQFQNKVSSFVALGKEDAVHFVDTIAASEEAAAPSASGGGATPRSSKSRRRPSTPGDDDAAPESDEEQDHSDTSSPIKRRRRTATSRSSTGKRVRASDA